MIYTIFIILIFNVIFFYKINFICASNYSIDHHYKLVQKKLNQANYKAAIKDLINLQNLYLFDPYPQQIYLDLIYAYYKSNNLILANTTINNFFQLYPNHNNLDYVLYIHGITNMQIDNIYNSTLIKYLKIDWYAHNPMYAHVAFHSLIKLINNYPNSQYITDAHKRLFFLRNRIAEHELSIIKFYYKKHAYISVITRVEKMLYYFPNTQATYKALFYLKQAYHNIHLFKQSDNVEKLIFNNPKY